MGLTSKIERMSIETSVEESTLFWTSNQGLFSQISFASVNDSIITIELNIKDKSFSFHEKLPSGIKYLKFHFNDCSKFLEAMNALLSRQGYGITFLISNLIAKMVPPLKFVHPPDSSIFDSPLNTAPSPEGTINNYEIIDPDSIEKSEELIIKFITPQIDTMLSISLVKDDVEKLVSLITDQYNLLSVKWVHEI